MRKTFGLAIFLIALTPAVLAGTAQYSGEAVVRSISPTRVAVFLDTDGDHSIDEGFLLDHGHSGALRILRPFLVGEVELTDGYVRLTSDKKLFDLQVAGYPDPPQASRRRRRRDAHRLRAHA